MTRGEFETRVCIEELLTACGSSLNFLSAFSKEGLQGKSDPGLNTFFFTFRFEHDMGEQLTRDHLFLVGIVVAALNTFPFTFRFEVDGGLFVLDWYCSSTRFF